MREDGRAFGDEGGDAIGEAGGDEIALPGDPARIGDNIHDIAGAGIEGDLHGVRDSGRVAAVHMDHALGLSGGARGVDEEHRIVCVERAAGRACPDGADEIDIGEREELGFGIDIEAGRAGGCEQALERLGREFGIPAVAFGAPDEIGLGGVADDDDGLDAGRAVDKGGSDGDAGLCGTGRIHAAGFAQFRERAADAAHHVGAFDRHFAGECFLHGVADGRLVMRV